MLANCLPASTEMSDVTRNDRSQERNGTEAAAAVVVVAKEEAAEHHPGSKHGHGLLLAIFVMRTDTLVLTMISHGRCLQTWRKGTTLKRNGMACAAVWQRMSLVKSVHTKRWQRTLVWTCPAGTSAALVKSAAWELSSL